MPSPPPVTLSSVKSILVPIFDKLFATPPESAGSQRMDNAAYMEVHTAIYDFSTRGYPRSTNPSEAEESSRTLTRKGVGIGGQRNVIGETVEARTLTEDEIIDQIIKGVGYEFYQFIDEYFKQKAGERASKLTFRDDKVQAVKGVLQQFNHYNAISRLVARMLAYFDRYYIKRVTQDGAGWLRKSDIDAEVMSTEALPEDKSFTESLAYMHTELEHIGKWGYTEGGKISRDDALASTQAASSPDRIIHMHPLALRRFRTEVVEPLILNSDEMVKWIKLNLMSTRQEEVDGDLNAMVTEFREMLRRVGVLEKNFFS